MILEVKDLSFSYGKRQVLKDISFAVEKGSFLSVLGPNGVGKSTLFRCILCQNRGYSGEILLEGDEVRSLPAREMARRIAYIPQIHRPTFGYTVLDTVLMGMTRQMSVFSSPKPEHIARAEAALERLGIAAFKDRLFPELSGGEQQLVLVARAIAQEADVLIMDEPTSALDFGNQFRILEQVRQLTAQDYTVLLSTHNPQHALSFADRVLALAEGQVAALGTAAEVMTPALMQKLYRVETEFTETAAGRVIIPKTGERYDV